MKTNYLQFEDVVLINEMSIEQHGGNFVPPHNFLHEESLRYVLESVGAEMFGEPLYPSISDKAAVYMFNIISNHVFQDGNKRTGLEAALLFLKINGWRLIDNDIVNFMATEGDYWPNITPDELYKFTMAVASGQYDLEGMRAWFATHARAR